MAYSFYITPQQYNIALENGISERLATERVRTNGWTVEKAITQPSRKSRKYGPWLEVAKENNVTLCVFYSRVSRQGMTMEEAATTPIMQRKDIIEQMAVKKRKEVYNAENIETAKSNGVTYRALQWRLMHGWTVADAIGTKKLTPEQVAQRAVAKSYWKLGPSLFVKKGVTA